MHVQVLEYPDALFCRSWLLSQETAVLVFQEVCNYRYFLWEVSSEPWFVTRHQHGAIPHLASGFTVGFGHSGLNSFVLQGGQWRFSGSWRGAVFVLPQSEPRYFAMGPMLLRPIQNSLLASCCPLLRAGVSGKLQVTSLRKMNRSQAPPCFLRVIIHLVVIMVYAGIEPMLLHRRAFMSWPDSALSFCWRNQEIFGLCLLSFPQTLASILQRCPSGISFPFPGSLSNCMVFLIAEQLNLCVQRAALSFQHSISHWSQDHWVERAHPSSTCVSPYKAQAHSSS